MASVLGGFAGLGGGSIGHAVVDLVLNAGTYEGELAAAEGKTKAATASMGQGFSGFQQQVKSSFSGAQVAAVGFGAVAAGAIVKAVGAATEWASEVRSLQLVTGQSAESASQLASAANSLGINVTQLNTAFGLLEKNIVNNSKNLTKYGIVTRDAQGQILPFNTILGNVSDKYATLATQADKTAFAQNIFGKSGKALLPILNEGSAGLQNLYDNMAPGLILTQQQVDAAKQLGIAERDLGEAFKGVAVSIGNQFIPAVTRVLDDLTSLINLFDKIPAPIKASVLAFVALNGALVALRGIWTATTGIIAENAAALGANAAAAEADAAASEQDAASKGILNSAMVENVAGLAALTKGMQDAIAEFDAFKAGNYPGVLHAITSELSFYTTGLVKTTPDLGAFQDGLSSINAELKAGTITTQDATTQAQALATHYGVTLPQAETDYINAQSGANTATDTGASSLGGMTDAAYKAAAASGKLSQAQKDLKSSVATAAQGILTLSGSVKQTFDISLKEENHGFASMLASAVRFKADMKQLENLKLGLDKNNMVAFETFMSTQGPNFIDRFVNSSKAKQQQWVNQWQKSANDVNGTIAGVGHQMDALSNKKITIQVDTQQIASASARADRLMQELARLGGP